MKTTDEVHIDKRIMELQPLMVGSRTDLLAPVQDTIRREDLTAERVYELLLQSAINTVVNLKVQGFPLEDGWPVLVARGFIYQRRVLFVGMMFYIFDRHIVPTADHREAAYLNLRQQLGSNWN